MTFFTEHLGSIVVGLVVLGVLTAAVLSMRRARRQGGHCGGGCAGCPANSTCGRGSKMAKTNKVY